MAASLRIKADHPFYGYRRVWSYLRNVEQQTITQKTSLSLDEAAWPTGAPQSAAQSQPGVPSVKTTG